MSVKKLISKSLKRYGRSLLRRVGYDVVYFNSSPGTFHRYPYANQRSFFQDLKSRGYAPARVIDIGANHGSWSEELASVFPTVESILVEPQEELAEHLFSLSSRHNNWKVASVGVAGANGLRRFHACEDTVSSSFLTAASEPENGAEVRDVRVITLDSLAEDYLNGQRAEIVKIDAEGLELEILGSGPKTIQSADIVMLEVAFFEFSPGQPKFADLVIRMSEFGFSAYDFTMFRRRPNDGALGLMDCVFVSDTCALRQSHAW